MLNSANIAIIYTIMEVAFEVPHYYRKGTIMSTRYQAPTGQASVANQVNLGQVTTNQVNATDQVSTGPANLVQAGGEYGSVTLESISKNNISQINTEYGSVTLELNQSTLERHIAEAKIQLNIARDQLRTLTKANRDLIAGNVTSYISTGSVTIGGVLYAVIESKLDFGTKLGRLQFNGTLGGLPVGVNGYNGGAEFFLSPDQIAALGTVDIQVDATPVQCFICWRHNTRILGAFYGTGSGVNGLATIGNGTFKQIS